MAELERYFQLAKTFESDADFVVIYGREAHASDEWDIDNNARAVPQTNKIEDRLAAAQTVFQMAPSCPLLVDDIQNEAAITFRGLPERLIIILDRRVVYEGARGPEGYDMSHVKDYLKENRKK